MMNYNDTLAKYVRKVCNATISTPSVVYKTMFIGDNGQKFEVRNFNESPSKVGDTIYIAKPISVLKHEPKQFEIHEVIVPVPLYIYLAIEKEKDSKKKRQMVQAAYAESQMVCLKHRSCVTKVLSLL